LAIGRTYIDETTPLKSVREAEAIASYRGAESWQLHEIQAGVAEFTKGRSVPHAAVVRWLLSWGKKSE
jgi:predicted transcriptional regulator